MTVATYMRTALLDPMQGYYSSSHNASSTSTSTEKGTDTAPPSPSPSGASREVIGAKGDFITSPEISQVFGELVAVYFVARWQQAQQQYQQHHQSQQQGTPLPLRLIELGPGRGTLLSDVLRTLHSFSTRSLPGLFDALRSIHLVETSPGLRALQAEQIRSVVEGRAGMRLRVLNDADAQEGKGEEEKELGQKETVPVLAEDVPQGEVHVRFYDDIHEIPIGEPRALLPSGVHLRD